MYSARVTRSRQVWAVLWRTLFLLLFAGWWGGLTFYALFVVPIGTEQIGSAEQGFITQQVTRWHNALLIAMTGIVLIEARRRKRLEWWSVGAFMAVIAACLFFAHWHLSGMIDLPSGTISSGFYRQHALYLWLTAVEWAAGLAVAVLAVLPEAGVRPEMGSEPETARLQDESDVSAR